MYFLETHPPVILDGYFAIWMGLDGAGTLQNSPIWTGGFEKVSKESVDLDVAL